MKMSFNFLNLIGAIGLSIIISSFLTSIGMAKDLQDWAMLAFGFLYFTYFPFLNIIPPEEDKKEDKDGESNP